MMKIKELRTEFNLTQKDIALKLGCNQTAVGKYERGELEPNIQVLIKLSAIFGCTVDYLLGVDSDYVSAKSSESNLTYEEYSLVKMYRILSERDKNFISDVFNRLITPEERAKLNLL